MGNQRVPDSRKRNLWNYDYIWPFMEKGQQLEVTARAFSNIPSIDYIERINGYAEEIEPEEMLGVVSVDCHFMEIRYNAETFRFLTEKPPAVIQRVIEVVSDGIQSGLEMTLSKQDEYIRGVATWIDRGYEDTVEMKKGIVRMLNDDKELNGLFTKKEKNYMADYFASRYSAVMGIERLSSQG